MILKFSSQHVPCFSSFLSFLSLGVLFLNLNHCAPPQPTEYIKQQPDASLQKLKIDLPRLVKLNTLLPALKYKDGAFRVDGLLMRPTQYLETEISLKGYIVKKYKCPRRKKGQKCAKPHLWIAHQRGQADERMRIVGIDQRQVRKFKENKRYIFQGTFSQSFQNDFIASRGLLIYKGSEIIKE